MALDKVTQTDRTQYSLEKSANQRLKCAAAATGRNEGDILSELIRKYLPEPPPDYLAQLQSE